MQCRNGNVRPTSSLSEHVAREIQRDYPVHLSSHRISHPRRGAINSGARGIKRFVFATAGGVKRVSVATGRKSIKVGGSLKRSVTNFTKKAVNPSKSIRNGARGVMMVSPPIIATEYTPIAQHSPFFTESPIHSLPPSVNPASSIEELLRAYGVKPGPIKQTIPPPPARAIFPPEYKTISRIHVRSRPGSSRPFSRSSNRPFNPRHTPSVISCPPSTRSDASSDVLGLVPLYEETGKIPSPWIRRPKMRGREERPSTAGSIVPKLRSRNGLVEVVSCATQTSPPPTVTSFPPNTSIQKEPSELEINDSRKNSSVGEKGLSRSRRRKRKNRGLAGNKFLSAESHTNVNPDILTSKPRQRRKRRDQCVQTTVEENKVTSVPVGHDHQRPRSNDRYNRASPIDIENVTEAMEDYYRSQGLNIKPGPISDISIFIPDAKDFETTNRPRSKSLASDHIARSPVNSVERHPSIRGNPGPHPESRGRSTACSSATSKSVQADSRQTQMLCMQSTSQLSPEPIQAVSSNKYDYQPLRHEEVKHRYKEFDPNASPTQVGYSTSNSVSTREQGRIPTIQTTDHPQYLSHFDPRRSMNLAPEHTNYNRPLDPRLSHFSADTNHIRDPSDISEPIIPVGRRHSHGPLSLTVDRYRGACTPSPATPSAPIRNRRRLEGLSIDTTLSSGPHRTSPLQESHSPLLLRKGVEGRNKDLF